MSPGDVLMLGFVIALAAAAVPPAGPAYTLPIAMEIGWLGPACAAKTEVQVTVRNVGSRGLWIPARSTLGAGQAINLGFKTNGPV